MFAQIKHLEYSRVSVSVFRSGSGAYGLLVGDGRRESRRVVGAVPEPRPLFERIVAFLVRALPALAALAAFRSGEGFLLAAGTLPLAGRPRAGEEAVDLGSELDDMLQIYIGHEVYRRRIAEGVALSVRREEERLNAIEQEFEPLLGLH